MHRLLPAGRAKAPDELADSLTVMAGENGLRVGHDLALTGFDDTSALAGSLTTLRRPCARWVRPLSV
ncbi:hypothetical protein ABZ424_08635 [Streptomyces sp. NPDC005790]|uniref:hypothetical protein n=1 Tax=Streptomyces sp. NPDC005790 TaxID=3154777 RepID=UPI0033F8C37F